MAFTRNELERGIVAWREADKPTDFHNLLYLNLGASNPMGKFDVKWWGRFSSRLEEAGGVGLEDESVITSRFEEISQAWDASVSPNASRTLGNVHWESIAAFPTLIQSLCGSPDRQFTAWFCHLIAPSIFPAVDRRLVMVNDPDYRSFFSSVQKDWQSTGGEMQQELLGVISDALCCNEILNYPYFTKIAEISLLGRQTTDH